MNDFLIFTCGLLFSLNIVQLIYYKYLSKEFTKLIDKQKEDMAQFVELHKTTMERYNKQEEELTLIKTELSNVKSKPIQPHFGTRR